MNHSQLIFLRNAIQDLDFTRLKKDMNARQVDLGAIKSTWPTIDNHFKEYDEFKTKIQLEFNAISQSMATVEKLKRDYIQEIYKIIRDETFEIINDENIFYELEGVKYKSANFNRNYRQLKITEETKELIIGKIGSFIDWKYPGLEIGPGDGEWTRHLVSADPLYLIDYNDEVLEKIKASFNQTFRNRLRCYKNIDNGLHMLPQNQFGFVFSWNTFNYFSMDQINGYLKEIYNIMRPGGACMFSYNNAERPHSAKRSEEKLMSFIPEQVLTKIIRKYGFENIVSRDADSTVSWVEFQKPGELSSQRGGQTLGKIIRVQDI